MIRRSCFGFVCAFLLITPSPAKQAAGDFSLEQIMGSPFPSNMKAGPQGTGVAWVMNEKGARNLWVAQGPDYQGRQLTAWNRDDGTTLSMLSWSPDGKKIAFVRGDGMNRSGEFPNPLNLAQGTEQAVWIVDLAQGEPRRLASGRSPTISPRGDGLVFLHQKQVLWMAFQEKAEPKVLVKPRGNPNSLRFSPDGSRLAFVSNRGDHSFIGVYRFDSENLRYLDPSLDRDSEPVWSPNGRQIAFLRIPSGRRPLIFTPRRRALPFSIRIVDLQTLDARELWKADEGSGSAFRNIVASNQLLWSSDGFVVFPWEKDGWTHLYSVPAQGGSARLLTPGDFEVEQVSLSSDSRRVVYSSNQDDIDRRHLWSVPAQGGRPRALTSGSSNEWSPTPLSDSALAMIRSTGTQPAHPALLHLEQNRVARLAPSAADFPVRNLVEPEQVIFNSADGRSIHGQLFRPDSQRWPGRRPGLLYFHGGSRRQMLLGWHYSSYYHNCYAFNQYMASRGFVVLSVNYRSGIGYGMKFREASNYGASGASEFNDVLGAGIYLRGRDDVSPERIGLWGGSYGGYLTALGLARASDLFAAGVDVHGVHDWNVTIKGFVPSYNPLQVPEASRLAFESSPLSSIDTWRSPVLLIHGDDDRNVPFSESIALAEALREQGVEFEQLVFPDEVHGFLRHQSWMTAFRRAAAFLSKHLEKGSSSLSGER